MHARMTIEHVRRAIDVLRKHKVEGPYAVVMLDKYGRQVKKLIASGQHCIDSKQDTAAI